MLKEEKELIGPRSYSPDLVEDRGRPGYTVRGVRLTISERLARAREDEVENRLRAQKHRQEEERVRKEENLQEEKQPVVLGNMTDVVENRLRDMLNRAERLRARYLRREQARLIEQFLLLEEARDLEQIQRKIEEGRRLLKQARLRSEAHCQEEERRQEEECLEEEKSLRQQESFLEQKRLRDQKRLKLEGIFQQQNRHRETDPLREPERLRLEEVRQQHLQGPREREEQVRLQKEFQAKELKKFKAQEARRSQGRPPFMPGPTMNGLNCLSPSYQLQRARQEAETDRALGITTGPVSSSYLTDGSAVNQGPQETMSENARGKMPAKSQEMMPPPLTPRSLMDDRIGRSPASPFPNGHVGHHGAQEGMSEKARGKIPAREQEIIPETHEMMQESNGFRVYNLPCRYEALLTPDSKIEGISISWNDNLCKYQFLFDGESMELLTDSETEYAEYMITPAYMTGLSFSTAGLPILEIVDNGGDEPLSMFIEFANYIEMHRYIHELVHRCGVDSNMILSRAPGCERVWG